MDSKWPKTSTDTASLIRNSVNTGFMYKILFISHTGLWKETLAQLFDIFVLQQLEAFSIQSHQFAPLSAVNKSHTETLNTRQTDQQDIDYGACQTFPLIIKQP